MSDRPLESWLRDAIFDSPYDLLEQAFPDDFAEGADRPTIRKFKELELVSAGRCDILLAYRGRVVIVEVKREIADENAIAQCLRYVGAFRQMTKHAFVVNGVVASPSITVNAQRAAMAGEIECVMLKPAVAVAVFAEVDATTVTDDEIERLEAIVYPKFADMFPVSSTLRRAEEV